MRVQNCILHQRLLFRFGMPRVPIGSKLNEGSLKKVADANRIYDVPQISEI